MNGKHRQKILVVAHDAGGAELIAAYMRKYARRYEFHSYVDGLAARIFARDGLPFKRAPRTRSGMAHVIEKHRDVAFALIGTGWMTEIEAHACKEAKRHGIRACMYLDSWMNYRGRFGYPKRGWQERLPDEFWVGDSVAVALAHKAFPDTPVRLIPNEYFANIKKRYRVGAKAHGSRRMLLFFSTPDAAGRTVLSALLKYAALLRHPPDVLIRFHPADNRGRYDALRKRYGRTIRIHVSREKDIVRDLLRARCAVGPETMALAVAALVGVCAVCVTPSGKKPVLPFPHMYHARSVRAAAHTLGF